MITTFWANCYVYYWTSDIPYRARLTAEKTLAIAFEASTHQLISVPVRVKKSFPLSLSLSFHLSLSISVSRHLLSLPPTLPRIIIFFC